MGDGWKHDYRIYGDVRDKYHFYRLFRGDTFDSGCGLLLGGTPFQRTGMVERADLAVICRDYRFDCKYIGNHTVDDIWLESSENEKEKRIGANENKGLIEIMKERKAHGSVSSFQS